MSKACEKKQEIDRLIKDQGDAIANIRNQIAISQIYKKAIEQPLTKIDNMVISALLSPGMVGSFKGKITIDDVINGFNNNKINKALSSSTVDPKYTKLDFSTLSGINTDNMVEKMKEIFNQITGLKDNEKIQNTNKKLEQRIESLNKDIETLESDININEKDKNKTKRNIENQIQKIRERIEGIDIVKALIAIPNIASNNLEMFPAINAISKEYEANKKNNEQSKLSDADRIVKKLKIENNTVVPNKESINQLTNLTALAVLFGITNNVNDVTKVIIPEYVKNVIKIESISAMEDIYKSFNDKVDDKEFDSKWGLDNTSEKYIQDKERAIRLNDEGVFPAAMVIRSLGSSVYKGLPVQLSSNISNQLKERAIVELGLYTLKYMENLNLVSNVIFDSHNKEMSTFTGKVQGLIKINHEISKDVLAMSSAFQYINMSDPRSTVSHEPITYVDKKIRHSFIDKPKAVVKSILEMQSKKYEFSEDISTVAKIYGDGKDENKLNMAYAMAGILDVPKDASIYDKMAQLGAINYSKMQFDEMMRIYNEMQLTGDTDIYFPFDYTVSGRYMINSVLNPQESKVTRFLITSKDLASHIDIKDGKLNSEQLTQYNNSLSQAFDLDPDKHMDETTKLMLDKIVTVSNTGTVTFNKEYKNGLYRDAFIILQHIINNDSSKYEYKVGKDDEYNKFIKIMTELNEDGAGFHAVQALMSLVKLSNSQENDEILNGSKFDTAITLESDAITSGMILSLLQMGTKFAMDLASKGGIYTKEFTELWLSILHEYNSIEGVNPFPILKDKDGNEKITHGLLKDLSKAIESNKGLAKKIADKLNLDDVNKLKFADFYETVANSANEYMQKDGLALDNEIESMLDQVNQGKTLSKSGKYQLRQLKNKSSMIKFIGSINRSLAKPGVMVYIYGAMMSSIRKMLTSSVVVPKIYKLLNTEKYKRIKVSTYLEDIKNNNINYADYNDDILALMLKDIDISEIQFKEYKNGSILNITFNDDKTFNNMIISDQMIKNLNSVVSDTLGDAFEEGFKPFKPIDDFRLSIKTLEIARFSMFKYQYKRKLERLIASHKSNNGTYEISVNDMSNIIVELEKEGYGHSVDDINGGKQPLYKRVDIEDTLRTALHIDTKNGFRSAAVDSKDFIINTGASAVIIIHSIDGFIDSTSAAMFNLIRIYDGSVSSINKLTEQAYAFNEKTAQATTWNAYNSQAKQISYNISDMMTHYISNDNKHSEFEDMLNTMSDSDKENLLNTLEKLMGYNDVEYITPDVIDDIANGVKTRVQENMDYRTTDDGKPTKISILNQYVTDASYAYVHELSNKPSTVITDSNINTIYDGFSKIVSMLQTYKRYKRYGEESDESENRNIFVQKEDESIKDLLYKYKYTKENPNQTVILYPTTLKYDGYIGKDNINSKYQNNAIGIPVALSKRAINHDLTDDEYKSIYKAIDLAFSLIPKDRDVVYANSLAYMSIIKDIKILKYIHQKLLILEKLSKPNTDYKNYKSNSSNDASNANSSGSNEQEATSGNIEPLYAKTDISVEDGANLYYEAKNADIMQEFKDSSNDIMSKEESSKLAKDIVANC